MMLLDTNIISELMKPTPNHQVIHWINQQNTKQLFVSSITLAEISLGIAILPNGARKESLVTNFQRFINVGFDNRILSFDASCSEFFAQIMLKRKQMGRPTSFQDGLIAAIAVRHRLSIVTRNVKDFDGVNLSIINPFDV